MLVMVLTAKLKLRVPKASEPAFRETIKQVTESFNRVSKVGYDAKLTNGVELHRRTYRFEKDLTKLPSQLVCCTRVKATEALSSVRKLQQKWDRKVKKNPAKYKPKTFRCPNSKQMAIRYDRRSATVKLRDGKATLVTVEGRQEVSFGIPERFVPLIDNKVCSCDLILDRKGRFFLHVVLEVKEPVFWHNNRVVGVDLGISRHAVISDAKGTINKFFGNRNWRVIEQKAKKLRQALRSKGTRSAKRHLRKIGRRVNRFRNDCDHVIAKAILVAIPKGTILAMEDLTDIREAKGRRKNGLHSWSFERLKTTIEDKAKLAGCKVDLVNPRDTSRQCSRCGDTRKSNRKSQSRFLCHACHLSLDADLNASRNIAKISFYHAPSNLPAVGMPTAEGCQSTSPSSGPSVSSVTGKLSPLGDSR